MFYLGMVVGIILISGVACLYKPHRHEWQPTAITHMTKSTTNGDGRRSTDMTATIYVCPCGQAKTENFVGVWELADFIASSPPIKGDSDVAALRKMAGLSEEDK